MSTAMRAKMWISNVRSWTDENGKTTGEELHFKAVCANQYDESGLDENNTFAKFTPNAELNIGIHNPALFGKFNLEDVFYVDFTPVIEAKVDGRIATDEEVKPTS